MKVVFYRADFGLFLSVRLKTSVFSQKKAKKVKKKHFERKGADKKIKKSKKKHSAKRSQEKTKKVKKNTSREESPTREKCEVTKKWQKNHLRLESCFFLPYHAPKATI